MPYKTWIAGEELLAGDLNTYIAEQVVPRFASAAARDAALSAPDKGQLCTLDNYAGALWIYTGTTWAETGPYQQAGYHTQTLNAGSGGAVTYPKAFATGPNLVVMTNAADSSATFGKEFSLIEAQNTSTGFGFLGRYATGALAAGTAVKLFWFAQGLRAPD